MPSNVRNAPRYFLLTLLVFWIPVGLLGPAVWKRASRLDKRAFWHTVFLLTGLTTLMESIYLSTKIWTFSEEMDPLLGPRIRGVPIEEYSFWFGATPFMLLVYLAARLMRPKEVPADAAA